jgi:hypothetical protein
MKIRSLRTKRKREESLNSSIINRGCSANFIHGMKNISCIHERSFVKFAA